MTVLNDDLCWQAVESRDRSLTGAFLVCVKTTKIYCHPFCSGRPLRKNVTFASSLEEARAKGCRACLRCKPDDFPEKQRIYNDCRISDMESAQK